MTFEHLSIDADPQRLRESARTLAGTAEDLRALTGVLDQLRGTGVEGCWVSASGEAFAARLATFPRTMVPVAERYDEAASLLLDHAITIELRQADAAHAVERFDANDAEHVALVGRVGGLPDDDPTRPVLEARRDECARLAVILATRVKEIHEQVIDTDRRLAARLHALADDSLTDSPTYRWLVRAQTATVPVTAIAGKLGPAGSVLSAGSGLTGVGIAGIRAWVYDEGGTAAVLKEVGVQTTAFAGAGLARAATKGAPIAGALGPALPARRRIALGLGETMRPWRARAATGVNGSTAVGGARLSRVAALAARTPEGKVVREGLDDWRRVLGSDVTSRHLMLGSLAARGAVQADRTTAKVATVVGATRGSSRDLSLGACPPRRESSPSRR
ncbi:WXG100 family type VII secretion target [Janibacter sp. G1551]|uniref:WXG100 family type VII secretion target n=1 Tax=Janibacter sp. G1551 TaxID=3420440 RepID=UPI003D0598FF